MSTQIIILSLFIIPWLTMLFFGKENRRRFIPTGMFVVLTGGTIYQLLLISGLYIFKEIHYPLIQYGLLPVTAMWVLRFTYGRFWKYVVTNLIVDIGFAFVLIPFFGRLGLVGLGSRWVPLIAYAINFVHAVVIYLYQMWLENSARSRGI